MREEKLQTILSFFKSDPRINNIKKLFGDYGVTRVLNNPFGHNVNNYVGVYEGGWVDVVHRNLLNVADLYNHYKKEENFDLSSFHPGELMFCAVFSHIWKLGRPYTGGELYVEQTNSWRANNLGEKYTFTGDSLIKDPQEKTLFILQQYGIKLSENEFEGIYNSNKMLSAGGAMDLINKNYHSVIPFLLSVNYVKTVLDMKADKID